MPPVVDGNSPISKYILERRKLDFDLWEVVSCDIEGAAHVVDDLLPDVAYVFRVSASNAVGIGPTSDPSEPVTIEDYDSDSPTVGQVQLKTTPFHLEYQLGEEIAKLVRPQLFQCVEGWANKPLVKCPCDVPMGSVLHYGKSWKDRWTLVIYMLCI